MTSKQSTCLVLLVASLWLVDSSCGFATRIGFVIDIRHAPQQQSTQGHVRCMNLSAATRRHVSLNFSPFATDIKAGEAGDKEDPLAKFQVGAVVRVVAKDLKAYQVPPKGYGSFDENKNFVPAPADGERKTRNLVLPVGLRGVVTKVYDTSEISANFPIQVKFAPGEHTDEGYDPPVQFLMHLLPRELKIVS